jgi:hypothetical protein
LSFTDRTGRRSFTTEQLGIALGVPRDQAQRRLEALTQAAWRGQPLARLAVDHDGTPVGVDLAPIELVTRMLGAERGSIASSSQPETTDQEPLRGELSRLGLDPEQIDHLLRTFPIERVQRQLAWLPAREARNPAALFIRAVEQDWEPPREAR